MGKDLDFGNGTWEQAGGTVRGKLDEFNTILYGNGDEGVVTIVTGYRAQIRLLTWIVATGIAVGILIAAIFGIWLNNVDQRHKFGDNKTQQTQSMSGNEDRAP